MPGPTEAPVFDWRLFADATCAGLTPLIPLPFVDLAFEFYFRRRMPKVIAKVRGRRVDRRVLQRLGRRRGGGLAAGCLTVPVLLAKYIVKRLWRKIVYVLAIADATSLVSEYWHRAYLLDHVVRAGHVEPGADADRAATSFERVIREADTSPVRGLARQIIDSTGRVLRLLVRAKRRGPAQATESLGVILGSHWQSVERSFHAVAIEYNRVYVAGPDRPTPPKV
jgi:hypothetical protein